MKPTWAHPPPLPMRLLPAFLLPALLSCAPSADPPSPPVPAFAPAPGPPITPAAPILALRRSAPPSCELVPAAVLSLLPSDAATPVIALRVNGQILRLQLDTGAERSVLTPAGAAALGLAPGPDRIRVAGLGGAAGYGEVVPDRIELAGQTLRDLRLPVMRLEGALGLDGLLGADLLAPYQAELDTPARRLTLYRAYGCAHPAPPWPARALAWVDTGAGTAALPIVDAWLDGRPIRALLDTGANVSAVDQTVAAVSAATLRADSPTRSFGAGGLAIAGRAHRFARLELGDLTLDQPTLRVIRLAPQLGIGLVVGMDILADRRLWLDYAGRRVFVQTPPGS